MGWFNNWNAADGNGNSTSKLFSKVKNECIVKHRSHNVYIMHLINYDTLDQVLICQKKALRITSNFQLPT